MKNGALETLMLACGTMPVQGRILFLSARWHAALSNDTVTALQPLKPHYDALLRGGIKTYATLLETPDNSYDSALILGAKAIAEFQYDLAVAIKSVNDGGRIICAADNDAGGRRLEKIMLEAGLNIFSTQSKHKARACIGEKSAAIDTALLARWFENGTIHRHKDTGFFTQAGIYGWEKIDRGSLLLADICKDKCAGAGADFGCGYGFLAQAALKFSPGVTSITLIDTDKRALHCAEKNTHFAAEKIKTLWADITEHKAVPDNAYDFILMNPPFHEGKSTEIDLGRSFIASTARALKKNGTLWMVANAQLPYEDVLRKEFAHGDMLLQKDGFKIFRAKKTGDNI